MLKHVVCLAILKIVIYFANRISTDMLDEMLCASHGKQELLWSLTRHVAPLVYVNSLCHAEKLCGLRRAGWLGKAAWMSSVGMGNLVEQSIWGRKRLG